MTRTHLALPARLVLDRAGNKWAMLIINSRAAERVALQRLRSQVGGISQKMLSQTLKNLERDGLITRTAIAPILNARERFAANDTA